MGLERTDCRKKASVFAVIGYNFAELWEMPAVPLASTHYVVVQLLVEFVEES